MREIIRIMDKDDSKTATVTTYPVASQSTFNLVRSNGDYNNAVELETTEESDQPTEQCWISSSREWSMVLCFSIMAMMVTMDALILIPILPVSRSSVNLLRIPSPDRIRKLPENITQTHQKTQYGPLQSIF